MKNLTISIITILVFFASCKKDSNVEKSGYFILTELKKSNSVKSGIMTDSITTTFALGDIKASKEFYFILSNGGNNPITDIKISSNNDAFQIAPNMLTNLLGKGSLFSDFIPIISLSVIHGIRLNGVGYTDLLPMNENSAEITITGKTIEGGESINLKSTFRFSVNAKVMDIKIFDGGNECNLLNPTSSVMFAQNYGGLGSIRSYKFNSQSFKIKNIGNVTMTVHSYNLGGVTQTIGEVFDLSPLQDKTITLKSRSTVFELDGDGTITDNSRIILGDNGKGYFEVELSDSIKRSIITRFPN